jgi:hypothetical protein
LALRLLGAGDASPSAVQLVERNHTQGGHGAKPGLLADESRRSVLHAGRA